MKNTNCESCGKNLSFWNTALKKFEGKTVCSSCATKIARMMIRLDWEKYSEELSKAKEDISQSWKEVTKDFQTVSNQPSEQVELRTGKESKNEIPREVIIESKTRGYSLSKGCCGSLIFMNPLGLICGLCGSGKTKTKVYIK